MDDRILDDLARVEALVRRLLDGEAIGFTELWVGADGGGDWTIDGHLRLTADEVKLLLEQGAKPETAHPLRE